MEDLNLYCYLSNYCSIPSILLENYDMTILKCLYFLFCISGSATCVSVYPIKRNDGISVNVNLCWLHNLYDKDEVVYGYDYLIPYKIYSYILKLCCEYQPIQLFVIFLFVSH